MEAFLVVAVVLLLVLAAFQYEETSALRNQIDDLKAQVAGIPNDSTEISQLQQEINNLQSHFTTTTQSSAFKVVALCVDVSQSCPSTAGYVFLLTVQNTGVTTIPAGSDNSVSFRGGNGTSGAFGRTFNITIQAIPPGNSESTGFGNWQNVFGGGNQPPFTEGETITVDVCLWETQPCQQMDVTAGA